MAFGTHTKTAEPIEMLFELMARLCPRYHAKCTLVIPLSTGDEQFFRGKVAAHRHSMVHYPKTAEHIDMPLSMKTLVGPGNHVFDGVADPQGEGAGLGGCPGHSKALAIFTAAVAAVAAVSLQTSCRRRDHSICQASANSILKISGHRRCGLCLMVWLHSAGEVW